MLYMAQERSNLSTKLLDAALRKSKTATITDLSRDNTVSHSAAMR